MVISDLRPATRWAALTISSVTARSSVFERDFFSQPAEKKRQTHAKATQRRDESRPARTKLDAEQAMVPADASVGEGRESPAQIRHDGLGGLPRSGRALQNLDGFLDYGIARRTRRSGRIRIRRRDILRRRTNFARGRDSFDRNFLAAGRVVIRQREDQRGTVLELNQLLLRRRAVGADADGLAAMIVGDRARQNFSSAGRAVCRSAR